MIGPDRGDLTSENGPRGGFPRIRTWENLGSVNPGGGAEYGTMIDALRNFLDAVAAAAPDTGTIIEITDGLAQFTRKLDPMAVDELKQIWARRMDLPGQGQTLAPNLVITGGDRDNVYGTVVFGRYFLGGGGAVHGGAIPLLFDTVLGLLCNAGGRAAARTAYLHTDYCSITPVGCELDVRGWFVSEEGRKRVLRAELHHGDTLCAEAEGLFVELRPDQA